MAKLVSQIVAAFLVVLAARSFAMPWWVTAFALVLSVVIVHGVWERLFPDAFRQLRAVPISNDDPLMLAAKQRARDTWDAFTRIYPDHAQDSMVKFPLRNNDGEIENVWGDLLELAPPNARVYLRTAPVGEVDISDRNMTVSIDDIIDWQVAFTDGTLRGGYTMQATYRIFERETGRMPREFLEELQRYRALEAPKV